MKITGIVLALSLLVPSTNSAADIYKWVDDNGLTHYSDNRNQAPPNHQKIDDVMPVVHHIARPDGELTQVQQASANDNQQRRQRAHLAQTRHQASKQDRAACAAYERQLRFVQATLRNGYREPRGNKLRERRRKIQGRMNAECR